jgi:hypothetical protein
MPKSIVILSLAALLAACAHEDGGQLPAERDWEKGLDAARGPQIAPVGPIDTDQGAYNYIRRREQERDLGSRMTAAGLDEIITSSSQVLASAMAMPLFRAGVYYGAPRLIERACTSARRVTHTALCQTGNIDAVLQGCGAVAGAAGRLGPVRRQKPGTPTPSWLPTAAGRGPHRGGRRACCATAARDDGASAHAGGSGSRGFLIVCVARQRRPPATFLAGDSAPNTADAINDAFLRGVQAVRPVAHNPEPRRAPVSTERPEFQPTTPFRRGAPGPGPWSAPRRAR